MEITKQQEEILKQLATGYATVNHPTPILETPKDYGLDYQDVTFKAEDGVQLAAWYIPCTYSNKLIICNHPATFNRYGFPGHQEPWRQFQDVEVKFGKIYKALHEAGYHVLTYDFRNHGESGDAKNHIWGQGFNSEYKDVLAALDYVKKHDTLQHMAIGLFNPCAGGNAAMTAMTKHPEYFADVKAFVCAQPASINIMAHIALKGMGLGDFMDVFDTELEKIGGLKSSAMTPHNIAQHVTVPTFIMQNKGDAWTLPADVQKTFDLLGTNKKKLFWLEGSTKRFDGYNYFGEHPEQMIDWFNNYMK